MSSANNKKVLLMGRAGAGKTSMRSIIFANYLARDTKRLTATNNVEYSHLRFLGNLVLSLWDCGGQDTFMENYFESQRELIFRNAEVLIYVMEVRASNLDDLVCSGPRQRELDRDLQNFQTTADSIRHLSSSAKIFILVHKLDLVVPAEKPAVLRHYANQFNNVAGDLDIAVFGTSIWDETLFRAWSQIVCALIPNLSQLERRLSHFCEVIAADEVVLFEKSTFLVVSHATRRQHSDSHRYEKISNICKQFNLTCSKTRSSFTSLTIENPDFTVLFERFTQNTYVMLIISGEAATNMNAALLNIDYAREHFETLQFPVGATL
eukprot:Lankesteria_metandrocarpae@DN949_c0_g1_i1.p1